jgi:hypothetical protein
MTIRKNDEHRITFPLYDNTDRSQRKTGVTSWTNVLISIDAGAFAAATNTPTEIGQGVYTLALTAAEMNGDVIHILIDAPGSDPVDQSLHTSGDPSGSVVADGANTTSQFKTDLIQVADDYWRGVYLLMTTGPIDNQLKRVIAYDGTTKVITLFETLTDVPTAGDRFVLINK